MGGPLLYLENV